MGNTALTSFHVSDFCACSKWELWRLLSASCFASMHCASHRICGRPWLPVFNDVHMASLCTPRIREHASSREQAIYCQVYPRCSLLQIGRSQCADHAQESMRMAMLLWHACMYR